MYEHIRLDNNTCFYVGKGRGNRAWCSNRNYHHDNIVKKYGFNVHIVKSNLTEKEAFELERARIKHYVFDLGYGINIQGHQNSVSKKYLTNATWGGEGATGLVMSNEAKQKLSMRFSGKNNPRYGRSPHEKMSEEEVESLKQHLSNVFSGDKNPMFGVSPKDRMDEETYNKWRAKQKERKFGESNPNYGNRKLHQIYANNPELSKEKQGRPGLQNGRCVPIEVYKVDGEKINQFPYIKGAAEWLLQTEKTKANISTVCANISMAITKQKPYLGFTYKKCQ